MYYEVRTEFKEAKVAIAGLGGLGSNIAHALARVGIGELFLVDYDVVEPSNLNRQMYFTKNLGMKKSEALLENLQQVNPYSKYVAADKLVTADNVVSLFKDYDVVIEAFDNPKSKAMLVNLLLEHCKMPIIAASGMAGFRSPNKIKTKKVMSKLYLVGDGIRAETNEEIMNAPRVLLAAAHQATIACQILLGKIDLEEG
ncbi:MAG: thiamine biosynthesis protein ThiF [Alkaliphilus sp.]|jgi:sulfur carrier protein ThiS adenylyltransferase|nr:sulfur carrier protein ThiS adenylyltransferase ThiF [bacterium AH-315-G05]PHS35595.1 MAG: thiamine biosynthesis protein ThiF [Alkaliphilus sp.]